MTRVALALAVFLALVPAALAGGPRMTIGAVEDEAAQPTLADSQAAVALARSADLGGAIRLTATWARGDTEPQQATIDALQNGIDAAQSAAADVYLIAYPYGSSQTPLSDTDQGQFVEWLTALVRALPTLRHVIVGNEPNLNRFWLPQYGPDGEDVAAPAYEALLARAYDAVKAVSPQIEVLGGALAHAGVDKPGTGRDTHSPTAFIADMGAAYRASGRDRPIMDALSIHPYMLASNVSPTFTHPRSTTITIGDYWKLVPLLGQAFDGTAQKGSTLPIVYDEFGVESVIPPEKTSLYTGTEPVSTHPVDEATQAAYYAQALQLAFCQPNVRAFLVFSLIDSPALAGWQSGVYYVDRTPKTSFDTVRAAVRNAQRNVIAHCSWLHVTPQPIVNFFAGGVPTSAPTRFPVALTCDVDCKYALRVERLPAHSTTISTSGTATGGVGKRVLFPRTRLAPGTYRLTLTATATMNAGHPFTSASASFTITP